MSEDPLPPVCTCRICSGHTTGLSRFAPVLTCPVAIAAAGGGGGNGAQAHGAAGDQADGSSLSRSTQGRNMWVALRSHSCPSMVFHRIEAWQPAASAALADMCRPETGYLDLMEDT